MPAPSLNINARDLESYVPVFDSRRLQKPSVIEGMNFLFDVDGPRSAFASRFYNWFEWGTDTGKHIQSFFVEDQFFYCTDTGIWSIEPTSAAPILQLPVIATISSSTWVPWSFAHVGSLYYFAQPAQGLWQYNATTKVWKLVLGFAAGVPDPLVKMICESYGRLVVLSDTTVFWSALDDGEDFTPSTTTGAGLQALAILSKTAYRVDPVADGVIISTDQGWLKGEFVAAAYVFRWYVLSRDVAIFTPSMGTLITDVGFVALDTKGFHLSSGGKPQLWQPEMGAFLAKTYVKQITHNRNNGIFLRFLPFTGMLIVSFAPNNPDSLLPATSSIAYVYLVESGKWGVFNWAHYSWVEVANIVNPLHVNEIAAPLAAYMDENLYLSVINDTVELNKEKLPPATEAVIEDYRFQFSPTEEIQFRTGVSGGVSTGVVIYTNQTSNMVTDQDSGFEPSATEIGPTGLYDLGSGEPENNYQSVNSFMRVGPFRFLEQKTADETSMVTSLVVGSQQVKNEATAEAWLSEIADAAFDVKTGIENFRTAPVADSYDLALVPSDDGIAAQWQGFETANLVAALGSSKQFSSNGISAIYHHLYFSAVQLDQKFSVKTLDIGGVLTGRRL